MNARNDSNERLLFALSINSWFSTMCVLCFSMFPADVQLLLVNKGKVSTEQREMSSGLDPQIKHKDKKTEDDGGDCGVLESDKSLPPPAADEASRSLSQDGQQMLKER